MGKIIAFALVVLCSTAHAAPYVTTVESLAEDCAIGVKLQKFKKWSHPDNKTSDASKHGHCFGFLEAARQAAPTPIKSVMGGACFPEGLTNEDLAEQFVMFAYDHKEDAKLPAIGEVFFMFESKYPCPKSAR